VSHTDENKCIGCGVCLHHCSKKARSLVQTEQREIYIPPPIIKK
jgi:NAD-dependent dihydropyrimidine dehydrogenase PreA subunit